MITNKPDAFGDLRDYYKLYPAILMAVSSVGRPEAERQAEGDEFDLAWASGLDASASDYVIWFSRREAYRLAYRTFFRDWDVLLAPANIVNASSARRRDAAIVEPYIESGATWWFEDVSPWAFGWNWNGGAWPIEAMNARIHHGPPRCG